MSNTIDPQDYPRSIELSGADIDAMVTGYLECQLWAGLNNERKHEWRRSTFGTNTVCENCNLLPLDSEDMETACDPVPYDENYDVADISPEYVNHVRDELTEVVAQHPLAVRMYLNARAYSPLYRSELFGHDFYLTREGHGAGFWDRGLGDLGDYLTGIAKSYGSADALYDNGEGMLVS